MNKTHDFKLNMPDYSDAVDIDILNDNFRVIDDALMAGLCEKEYTGNNMGSSDPASRKYAWAPWFEIKNENDFDVQVTDRNFETTITIEAGTTYRKYIVGTYYMNFYVQDQHDVTFRWFCDAETRINEIDPSGGGSVSSVNVTGASSSHIVTSGGPITSSGTIEIDLAEGYSIPQTNKQTSWDGKAADLKAEIDSSTYVLTLQLKDSSGNLIGNERTIDLPLETMVVDGEYDPQTQKIKLELKNGNYVEFSVADLVSGLQTELNSNNKLNPEYIAYDASHRAVSDTEKDTWNGKQNAISDLVTIRSGATAGATAVQPSEMQTALDDKQDVIDSSHKLSSDLVDDTNKTNKFVTSTEKNTWNSKQNAIDADHKLSSSLVSFSEAEAAALASGINSAKVDQISTNQTNISLVEDMICDTEFSTSTAYVVGDIVTHENGLYEFTSAHSAGAWNSADVTQIDVVEYVDSQIPTVMGASGSSHKGGLVPDTPSTPGTTKFLREDGTWEVPSGGGGGAVNTVYIDTTQYPPDSSGKVVLPAYPTTLPANGGTASNVSGTVAILNGGTGATNQSDARTNLGLGSAATKSSTSSVTSGSTSLITSGGVYTALSGKQDTIDSSHKLSSALVSFSTAQNAALSSGIDSTKVSQINLIYSSLQCDVKYAKVPVSTSYSLIGSIRTKGNRVCRITVTQEYSSVAPTGLILSKSNQSSDFNTLTNRVAPPVETTTDDINLTISALCYFTYDRVVYIWAKAKTASTNGNNFMALCEHFGDIDGVKNSMN